MKKFTASFFIIITALYIVIFLNISFFKEVLHVYPLTVSNIGFLLSLALVLYALIVILFSLVSFKHTLKPILIIILLIASVIQYFMQSYHIIIDDTMIENILQTDTSEASDLISLQFFISLFFLGIIPSVIVYKIPLKYRGLKTEIWQAFKRIMLHFGIIILLLFSFSKFYTSFFREHKTLRFYTNPTTPIYNLVSYTYSQFKDTNIPMKIIGEDAKINPSLHTRRKIIIMVVGEAARYDHFSLNGYKKETNPLLKKENIINFTQMYSCGTTTAVSVPCMFSMYDRETYSSQKGYHTYNVLDILSHAGVEILWRDNNSDSKGVAVRLNYQSYKTAQRNTLCDEECRDEGMLVGLDKEIDKTDKDICIVLHQMGNHGPAYYKRYPKSFETFTPVCKTNQLENCTTEEISNAYDNALLYTDYFLSKVIHLLKKHEHTADTAMLYIADHGESLGEHGFYLHGLPYFMAPEHQKHVGALFWLGKNFPTDTDVLKNRAKETYSQDNLFSTLLGLFHVKTKSYIQDMDILKP